MFICIPVYAAASTLSKSEKDELLLLIKCCADIKDYDRNNYDMDKLMRNVLYTRRNFIPVSTFQPDEKTINNGLKMCSEKFISDSMYKAFRLEAKRPDEHELTSIGYCVANGYYYYYGGYTRYFATDVHNIANTFYTPDGSLYIIFSNSFYNGISQTDEYSTATARHDSDGWYLTSIHMNSDFTDMPEHLSTVNELPADDTGMRRYFPALIILITVALVSVIIRVYVI